MVHTLLTMLMQLVEEPFFKTLFCSAPFYFFPAVRSKIKQLTLRFFNIKVINSTDFVTATGRKIIFKLFFFVQRHFIFFTAVKSRIEQLSWDYFIQRVHTLLTVYLQLVTQSFLNTFNYSFLSVAFYSFPESKSRLTYVTLWLFHPKIVYFIDFTTVTSKQTLKMPHSQHQFIFLPVARGRFEPITMW